jgi:HK97 family phage prohead protease
MIRKQLSSLELKAGDEAGTLSAVFATFNKVDKDGDLTVPGAFEDGAKVAISAYGHKSWEGALPIGVGTVRTTDTEAIMEGKLFLDTAAGRDTYAALKAMHEAGVPSEFSYGFDVLDSEPAHKDSGARRVLKSMKVYEVSPVLLGAGVDTRTLAIKSQDVSDSLVGEAPSLAEELDAAIAALEAKAESAERVVALRSEAGKSISQANAEKFARIAEIAERFKALIPAAPAEETEQEEPAVDLSAEYLRFVQLSQEG